MRTIREVNDIGIRALVDTLGRDDAQRFLAQFRASGAAPTGAAAPGGADAAELPSMTVEESNETVRDIQDPIQQQHML